MTYRSFLSMITCVVILCFMSSVQAGGLNDTITITSSTVVDHFEVRFKETSGLTVIAVSDPADDPDLDGDIVVPVDGTGKVGTISVSKFLTGQPTAAYLIEAASVDANGQMSAWGNLSFTYDAPPAPTINVSFGNFTNYATQKLTPRNYAINERQHRQYI